MGKKLLLIAVLSVFALVLVSADPVVVLGDMNGDGVLDDSDVEDFVLALTDISEYELTHPGLDAVERGDMNGDGSFNNQDILSFVSELGLGDSLIELFGDNDFVLGDMNGDGVLDDSDVEDFVLALTDMGRYSTKYLLLNGTARGDMNQNGGLDNQDILGFVTALRGYEEFNLVIHVSNSSGAFLEQVWINITGSDNFLFSGKTDDEGNFEKVLKNGMYSLVISPVNGDDYYPNMTEVNLSEDVQMNITLDEIPSQPIQQNSVSGGSGGGGSGGSGTCYAQWVCTVWNPCVEGNQSRICSLANSRCSPIGEKPVEVQACTLNVVENISSNSSTELEEPGTLSRFTGAVIGAIGKPSVYIPLIFIGLLIAAFVIVTVFRRSATAKN